jgi:hypothetical protein
VLRTLVLASLLALVAAPARAFEEYQETRVLGMGGASRAFAIGGAGPLLNPSGMSLAKSYTVEGGYAYANRLSDNFLHASVVDSTSSYNIAGGLYYTYHFASPSGLPAGHGHEAGAAVSLPFGEILAMGATVKYTRLSGGDAAPDNHDGGVTFDIGATLKPTKTLSFGAVGTNLYDLHDGQFPRGIGYGAAFIPIPNLLVAADGRTSLDPGIYGRKGTSIMAGGDFTIAQRVGVRLGGGYDASTGAGYLTLGVSGVSELGAFDAGFRQDITHGDLGPGFPTSLQSVLGVSLRLFIPAEQAAQPLPSF